MTRGSPVYVSFQPFHPFPGSFDLINPFTLSPFRPHPSLSLRLIRTPEFPCQPADIPFPLFLSLYHQFHISRLPESEFLRALSAEAMPLCSPDALPAPAVSRSQSRILAHRAQYLVPRLSRCEARQTISRQSSDSHSSGPPEAHSLNQLRICPGIAFTWM